MYDVLVKNGKLVTPDRIYEADIAIQDGKYAGFFAKGAPVDAKEVIDAKGNYVFPGIIDCHAHLNEPGFEYREDFETGSRAAVVAGCTTLIDMPLNNDPSLMNKEIFDLKLGKISKHSLVDYALWGGIVGDYDDKPDSVKNNMNDLVDLHNCGVAAFKGFTCPNGDLFPTVNMGNVRKALEILKPYGALCGFHCEEYGQVLERESTACIKILVLNFIFCISVQCVCKISTELINIKMRCTSSSFFIWGKCDAKRAMRYILFVHPLNHSQNFCNTSFVISAENGCSITCNQCASF